jgi:glyoxylase-like metal-dependent hydrolase (beta-lactamase superfamily II)
MTGAGNHTYLIVSGGAAVLVDAGVGHPDHLAALDQALVDARSSLQLVLLTHDHSDHAQGAPAIAHSHPDAHFAKHRLTGDERPSAAAWRELCDRDELHFGETSIEALHTPGHSPDHVAFWHAPTRSLYSGDLLIAGGSVMIEASRGGDMIQYLRSLRRILALEPRRIWPAHGPHVDDPSAVVHAHIEHRLLRERQIVEAISAGHRTVEAIAQSIYDGLAPGLAAAAAENVRAHLVKLTIDKIAVDQDGWRIL